MTTCVPIKELKDTAKFSAMVEESEEPITVTKNGYGAFVVMRLDEYDRLQEQAAESQLMARIALAQNEYDEGRFVEGFDFFDEMVVKYGL